MTLPFSQQYVLTRPEPGHRHNGRWVESNKVQEVFFDASIEPMTSIELDKIPEGLRDKEHIIVRTTFDIKKSDSKKNLNADIVTYKSKKYEVYAVYEYEGPISHKEARAALVD